MVAVSEPVLDVLRGIRGAYRLARVAAIIGGPFGTNIGYSMQRLRGPAFTAYPNMLSHERSIASYNDPNGDGFWIRVIGEAQELFAERQSWENYYLFRYSGLSCWAWWISVFILIITTSCVLGAGNETFGVPLAWACGAVVLISIAGAIWSDGLANRIYRRNSATFDKLSSGLPDRLWPVIDEMRSRKTVSLSKET
jgi:hypothetical protein|nr:hypothetical protein [Neorhizobium tomejilense]